ncbi:hypothetical protein GPECTOR_32g412 [Gonium pectorale]|uniref:RecA-like N-terminal domain-containing protein n=1 Tax=Gonium pectorale TaxID=33097 RepID=A0A150GEN0_GONPE|nr:hypothetical protein GPECTOR_32g412 [Gonium pectorale]|eukprot:KXZ47800.1 hypothetical protein GPECTOR_32g412 [Gonium pectorale]
MDADQKARIFSDTVERIQNRFGTNTLMRLSDSPSASIATFPSGSLTLDAALGGGYPRGRIIEGREKVLASLREDHATANKIEQEVRDLLKANPDAALDDVEDGDDGGPATTVGLELDDEL